MNEEVFYETIVDLNLYLQSLKEKNVDLLQNEKEYFNSYCTIFEDALEINIIYSKQLCFAYMLSMFNQNKLSTSIRIIHHHELKCDISLCGYWEIMKHLCLYEEMKSTFLNNCDEIVYQFVEQFFDYIISPPLNEKDKEVATSLLRLSWNDRDKNSSIFSTSIIKYLSRRPRVLNILCESLSHPDQCMILLITIVHLYGRSDERKSNFQEFDMPYYLTLQAENKLELFASIYETSVKKCSPQTQEDTDLLFFSGPYLRECIVSFHDDHSSILEQDLISDLPELEKNLYIQCMLPGTESLCQFVMRQQCEGDSSITEDQKRIKHFAKCLIRFIKKNANDVLHEINSHTDSILWCLENNCCVKEIGLWFCTHCSSGRDGNHPSNDSDVIAQSDRMLQALMPLVSDFACVNSCQKLTQRIIQLNDRFVPVEDLYELLKRLIACLSDEEKKELYAWQFKGNLMLSAAYKNRLQICVNRISTDEEHFSNEMILELYLLLMADPEVTMHKLLRTGIETKGAFTSVIKSVSQLSFSFDVIFLLSSEPLLIAVLNQLLFGAPLGSFYSVDPFNTVSHPVQLNSESSKRRDALLLQILAMPDGVPMIPIFIERLILPHLTSSDSYLHTAVHLLCVLFDRKYHSELPSHFVLDLIGALSCDVLTILVATLTLIRESFCVSQILNTLVILSSGKINSDFVFNLLSQRNVPIKSHLLIHDLYKFHGQFINLSSIYELLFDGDILSKYQMKITGRPVNDCPNFMLLYTLLQFASTSSSIMSIAIEAFKSSALLELQQYDVTTALLKLLPELHYDEWERAIQFLCHAVRCGSLCLPYIPMCGWMPLDNMREYNGHLNVLQLLIRANETLSELPDNSHKQRASQNLFSSVKLLTRPFLPNRSVTDSQLLYPTYCNSSKSTVQFIRTEIQRLLDRYLSTSRPDSDRYQSIMLLQNELLHHTAECNDGLQVDGWKCSSETSE